MPRSKLGVKRKPVDAELMKKAVEAVTAPQDKRISIREACKVYNVKLATLSRHLAAFKQSGNENFTYSVNCDVKRIFSDSEEHFLVQYVKNVAKMNYGLSKKGVRELAYKFAVANGKEYPPKWNEEKIAGKEWMRWFMRRHASDLSIRKPEATSLSRSTSFNKANVDAFFKNLESVHSRYGPIPAQRVWNVDETGLSTVQTPAKIVAPKGVKQIGSCTSGERGNLITMIAAVNAIGNHIPPMLIFPRVFFKERMLFGAPPGTIGAAVSSGWSNDEMFLKFMEHFIKFVKCSKDERVLLILDNHETHLSVEAVERASAAGVVMVTFPPHTSNKLQPLDLTVYGPLKGYYNQGVDAWMINNPGRTFDLYCVAEVLGTAFPRAFSTTNIVSGFRKSGIFPLDRGVFCEDDFLGAYVTDREIDLQAATPSSSGLNLQPQNSGTSISETPEASQNSKKIVTPEEVQPYPKAMPRKLNTRGRRAGRTRIATDTPEKEEIRSLKEKRASKTRPKVARTNLIGKLQNVAKRNRVPSSSSSEDEPVPLVSTDDEDSTDEVCIFCNQ